MIKLNREEVIGLYETGLLQKEIAKKLGVSATTLSRFIKENDIETKKPTNYKKSSLYEEPITIINSENVGYVRMAIEKKRTIKNEDKNLYIPEKWNWRSYA